MILGSGPNRIGQGVEFDYCCVRAAMALPASWGTGRSWSTRIRRRSRPTSTSPTRSTSSRSRSRTCWRSCSVEQPLGVVVQLGGQTPLRLARGARGGGRADPRHLARGRSTWRRTAAASRRSRASSAWRSRRAARRLGATRRSRWPSGSAIRCWCARPTCSAAGRWRSCYDDAVARGATSRRAARVAPEHPVLIDRFLEDAFEADVDAISDGTRCVIGGVMQHIEDAGIHSGDSACVLPPYLITEAQVETMRRHTRAFARAARRGRPDQRAVRDQGRRRLRARGEPARLAARCRSSPRPPACRSPVLAARVMVRRDPRRARASHDDVLQPYVAVKEAVFPFSKLPGVDLDARSRDALDRRGHGHRRLVRDGVRQGADRGRRRAAARGRRSSSR